MKKKILVVDDSLTIQKVVTITLANADHELLAAHDEAELFNKLEQGSYDLILLDFSLSETKSGYELAQAIKEKVPNCSILAMVGTFDSIDDNKLVESGVNDSIVKPFESSKFIEKCNNLLSGASDEASSYDSAATDEDDEWEVNTATNVNLNLEEVQVNDDPVDSQPVPAANNSLKEEIEGWGISMPDVIEAAEIAQDIPDSAVMPPEIEHEENAFTFEVEEAEEEVEQEPITPAEDDLLFPESNQPEEDNTDINSRLVSMDELNFADSEDHEEEIIGEESIVKEFSHDDGDDFWAVDDELDQEAIETIEFSSDASDVEEIGPKLEKLPDSDGEVVKESLIEDVKDQLKPLIEEIVREKIMEMSEEIIERVAWEAIPDLAENLIRSEVKELSQKIQEKHSLNN